MQKRLNIELIKTQMNQLGFNQAKISNELKVSREAVSKWFKNESFPRPNLLLKLGKFLDLSYSDLVSTLPVVSEPQIAFRKVKGAKTKFSHMKRAKENGFALQKLVPFLSTELLFKSETLYSPQNDYEYIQKSVNAIREHHNFLQEKITIPEIIKSFFFNKVVLIPVLWGRKENHENSLYIFLPESSTYWVYVNLDTYHFDLKFWLIHELAHIFTPELHNNEKSEIFADNFAGAFLVPQNLAADVYKKVSNERSDNSKIRIIQSLAQQLEISPITIYKELNKFAIHYNKSCTVLIPENIFYSTNCIFQKSFYLFSDSFFPTDNPSTKLYVSKTEEFFRTPIFQLLKKALRKSDYSRAFVETILNCPITDAYEIYDYLTDETEENST